MAMLCIRIGVLHSDRRMNCTRGVYKSKQDQRLRRNQKVSFVVTFNYGFVSQKVYVTQESSVGIADGPGKSYGKESKHLKLKDCTEENASITIEESSVSISKSSNAKDKPSFQQGDIATHLASKKHQKLHWGLDTKERWERKANM